MSIFKKTPRKLTKAELMEIQELQRIAASEKFKADQMEKNTALFNAEGQSGKLLAANQRKLAETCERVKNEHVSGKLAELGYKNNEKVTIDVFKNKISVIK